jgi:hypothetical protein
VIVAGLDRFDWAVIVVSAAIISFVAFRRHTRDCRQYLEPPLKQCRVEYVSARSPKIFQTGPFPKFEIEMGRPVTNAAGVQGEYTEYRIVTFRDTNRQLHELWACVEFEAFKFRRVRWRAEKTDGLPAQIMSILEA